LSKAPFQNQTPWENRWSAPDRNQLLDGISDPNRRKLIAGLAEKFVGFEGVEELIIWHGTAWKWTFQYSLRNASGQEVDVLAYIVPEPLLPVVCIPLRQTVLEKMPIKRLNRFIREGLRIAKCAVELHWAMWNPNASTECDHLIDLFKRKHKLTATEPPQVSKSA
jgi:hypothetical protein